MKDSKINLNNKWFTIERDHYKCKLCKFYYKIYNETEPSKCPNCNHSTKDEQKNINKNK